MRTPIELERFEWEDEGIQRSRKDLEGNRNNCDYRVTRNQIYLRRTLGKVETVAAVLSSRGKWKLFPRYIWLRGQRMARHEKGNGRPATRKWSSVVSNLHNEETF